MDWTKVAGSVTASVLSAGIIAVVALLFEPIRTFFRYRSHEYFLWHSSKDSRCTWDMQWEGERLQIDAASVHNDRLENVSLTLNKSNTVTIDSWYVSKEFMPEKNWPIKIKLAAIVRRKTGDERLYNLHFVVRRKRW
jgi:hypothetical protein